jgi:hypothetical protein
MEGKARPQLKQVHNRDPPGVRKREIIARSLKVTRLSLL